MPLYKSLLVLGIPDSPGGMIPCVEPHALGREAGMDYLKFWTWDR